jgi:general secretion pathway protein I
MMKNPLYKKTGFSLIEVVIALAIASFAMAETYALISRGMFLQRQSISLTNAVFLAKIKLAQIDATPKLETTSSRGEIPGYVGYKYEVDIKEEELDLLKLAENPKNTKPPTDILGQDSNSRMSEILKKRGQSQNSKTGGLIKIFKIRVAIIYPLGTGEETYEAVTFKSSTF